MTRVLGLLMNSIYLSLFFRELVSRYSALSTMTPTPESPFAFLNTSDPAVQFVINLARAMAVLVATLVIARFSKQWTVRGLTRGRVSLTLATLLGNLAQVAVIVVGTVLLLPSFGVDWTGLLTLVGVSGLAISLSMQDLLKNVVAGIYILMEQPFRIGDQISVKEVKGTVQGIELRTTILCTEENLQVVVPNSIVLNEIVTNHSASNLKRQVLLLRIRKGSLTDTSFQINDTLKAFSQIANTPAPSTQVEGVREGVARLRVTFWLPATEQAALTQSIVEALQVRFPDADVKVGV